MLMKRLMGAVKDVEKVLQRNTEKIAEATKATTAKQGAPVEVRAEVSLLQGIETRKSATDASDDREYQGRTLRVAQLTLAAVAIYAAVAAWQLWEMRKATRATQDAANAAKQSADAAVRSATTAENSFRADERPYVTVYSIKSKTGPLKEGDNSIDFSIFNSGKTPALKVENTLHVIVSEKEIAKFSPNGTSEGVLAGNRVSTNNYTLRLSPRDAKDVATLQCKGTVTYIDVIGNAPPYQTTFCALYDLKTNEFKFCPSGNDVK